MKHLLPVSVLAFGIWAGLSDGAYAQYPPYSPYGYPQYGPMRPQLSPYLNLLRGGNPAANYYGGVLPERQRRAQAYQFGSEIQDLERREAAPLEPEDREAPRLGETGHYVQFLNLSPYYAPGPYPGAAPGTGYGRAPTGSRRR